MLDYSAGFPGAAAIKQAGYAGAVRYIGYPDRRKCTTGGELVDFRNNKIGMALVHESSADDWRGGYGAGVTNGRKARDHANRILFPADRPIYMAVDQDVVASGEFATMIEYLRGAGASLGGPGVTGVYGEADVVDRARAAGVASWFWQTAAWSRGRRTKAHLFQHVGTVNIGGIACDFNDVLAPDWGQHNGGGTVFTPEEVQQIENATWNGYAKMVKSLPNEDPPTVRKILEGIAWTGAAEMFLSLATGGQDVRDVIIGLVKAGNSDVLAAIAAIPQTGAPTDEQVARLAATLSTALQGQFDITITRRPEGQTVA